MKTMSLTGGIEQYKFGPQSRFKSDQSPRGRKVYFLNENGHDKELERAASQFFKGQVLTVKEIYVDRNSSEVEFLEVEGESFNTVMFADHEAPGVVAEENSRGANLKKLADTVRQSSEVLAEIDRIEELASNIDKYGIDLSTHNSNLNLNLSSETLAEIKRLVIAELTGKIEHDTESLHKILTGGNE